MGKYVEVGVVEGYVEEIKGVAAKIGEAIEHVSCVYSEGARRCQEKLEGIKEKCLEVAGDFERVLEDREVECDFVSLYEKAQNTVEHVKSMRTHLRGGYVAKDKLEEYIVEGDLYHIEENAKFLAGELNY